MEPKGKKDKLDNQIKNFYASGDIKKGNTHMEWEEILANHTSDKDLVPRLYKQVIIHQ